MERQGAGGAGRRSVPQGLGPLLWLPQAPQPTVSTPRQIASSSRTNSCPCPPCMVPQPSAVTAVGRQFPDSGARVTATLPPQPALPGWPSPTSCLTTAPSAVPGGTQCQAQVTWAGEGPKGPHLPREASVFTQTPSSHPPLMVQLGGWGRDQGPVGMGKDAEGRGRLPPAPSSGSGSGEV